MSGTENLRSGERRNVSVLFADMKGFTSLSEQTDPELMDSLMSRVFGTFESIIRRYEGTVEKYIGDALVAVFGVPTLHEDDPARAISASLDFIGEIRKINEDRGGAAQIAFRLGISTGLITTGRRGEHDVVTGHAMAVASRIQELAPGNAVLVAASTRERCEGDFAFGEPVVVQGRGMDEPVTAYRVTGRALHPADDRVACVGRKQVVDRILRRFLRHDASQTQGCILTGDAGIGKTRVAQELLDTVRRLPGFERGILYARARRYRTQPFAVVVDLLRDYFGLDEALTPSQVARAVCEQLEVEASTAEGFARLVSGEQQEQGNQTFVVLYLILKTIVKRNEEAPYSTLLCIDDLFFMDRNSRDFFQFYLRNADMRPFFLLMNRSINESIAPIFGDLEVIPVEPLGQKEIAELVDRIVDAYGEDATVHPEVLASIQTNSGGNPLFIREYTRYALENRDSQDVPSTIQNIFLTSLESFDEEVRDFIKKLSVFALNFCIEDAEHIEEMTQGDRRLVRPAIESFLREGILISDGEEYLFKYDLFKKALYDSLLNFNKKILHRIIADLMEKKGAPHPMRLLHHLLRAGEYDRATQALLTSPHATSNSEYLRYIDRIIEAVGQTDSDRYMKLVSAKSAILFNNGITEEVDSLLTGMIKLAVSRTNPFYAGAAFHLLTAYNMKAYNFGKARYCGMKALAYYERVGSGTYNHQNVLEIVATSELLSNQAEAADRIVNRIRELEEADHEAFSADRLAVSLAEHHLLRGSYRSAITDLELIRARVPRESELWQHLHLVLGSALYFACEWEALREIDEQILTGPSRHRSNISQTHARFAAASHFLGDREASDRRLYEAEFSASQIRNDFDRTDAYRTLASAYLMCGNEEKAREVATLGIGPSLRHSITYPAMTLLMVLVEVAVLRGDKEAADFYLREAELLVRSEVLLPRRDLLLFHYHSARSEDHVSDRDLHRREAAALLGREIEAVGPAQLPRLLEIRMMERLHREFA